MCHDRGVYLLSCQDSTDDLSSLTAAAKLSTGVKALLTETDTMSERQSAAKRQAPRGQAGSTNGGRRPFGWQPGPRVVDGAGRTGRRLKPHPVEGQALRDALPFDPCRGQSAGDCRSLADAIWDHGSAGRPGQRAEGPRSARLAYGRLPNSSPAAASSWGACRSDGLHRSNRDREPVISQEPVCDLITWQSSRHTQLPEPGWGSRGMGETSLAVDRTVALPLWQTACGRGSASKARRRRSPGDSLCVSVQGESPPRRWRMRRWGLDHCSDR